MGEVIPINVKRDEGPRVWVCGCGNHTYILHADGKCVCEACDCYDAALLVTFDEARRPPELPKAV